MSTQSFPVTGMTCGRCASAVSTEVREIPGVTDVSVDVVAGGALPGHGSPRLAAAQTASS